MEVIEIIILLGLVLAGFIIGYPLGHLGARRDLARKSEPGIESVPTIIQRCRWRLERQDILNAEFLEEKTK